MPDPKLKQAMKQVARMLGDHLQITHWFITFEPLTPNPATKRWAVMPKDGSSQIGAVSWHGPWRKYCFFPVPSTVFEQVCLRDIADFCERETRLHRSAKARP